MGRTATKSDRGRKHDAVSTLAEDRLSVLDLARELGNVAEAYRAGHLSLHIEPYTGKGTR